MKIEIKNRFSGETILEGDYESLKDCLGKNRGSNLSGSDLRDSNLRGITGYCDSHDVFAEAVRRQMVDVFSEAEWSAIAQITIHRLCWDSIQRRFPDIMPRLFGLLAEAGFPEWLEYWRRERTEP